MQRVELSFYMQDVPDQPTTQEDSANSSAVRRQLLFGKISHRICAIVSDPPNPMNPDVLRADASILGAGDRQTLLALYTASNSTWNMFRSLLRRAVRDDTDRVVRVFVIGPLLLLYRVEPEDARAVIAHDRRPLIHVGGHSS